MTFRNQISDFRNIDLGNTKDIIQKIDLINKEKNINLIVLNFNNTNILEKDLEEYLIKLNKKVLIISKEKIEFSNYFLSFIIFLGRRDISTSSVDSPYASFRSIIDFSISSVISSFAKLGMKPLAIPFCIPFCMVLDFDICFQECSDISFSIAARLNPRGRNFR